MFRNKLLVIALIALTVLPLAHQVLGVDPGKFREGLDENGPERRTGIRYPLPTAATPFEKYTATGTQTVGTAAAVLLTPPATYSRVVTVGATDGAINYGPSTVPTGERYPFQIASGSTRDFVLGTSTPPIYLRGRTATATADRLEW
jgi:hypothetical protein